MQISGTPDGSGGIFAQPITYSV